MATLTGFKRVQGSQKKQEQTNGQSNPTFTFDDVDANKTNEQQINASSEINNSKNDQSSDVFQDTSSQTPPSIYKKNKPDQSLTTNGSTSDTTESSKSSSVASHNNQDMNNIKNTKANTNTSDQSKQLEQQVSNSPKIVNSRSSPNLADSKVQQDQKMSNTLSPKSADPDSVSLSMLAIDCSSTGKSPRQPRRSPLMALFRGKPRESTRRLYTDEDQFEIEWADLSLEFQKKWHHKFSLSKLLTIGSTGNKYVEEGEPIRKILKNVDGRIRSGEITAVLGPSGAGKTSLLNSLFGKYRNAIQGTVKVTGAPSKKHLTVCTIPQSDYLIGYLTTEESLWFASRLKNCEDDFNHDRNIERVIELLGLQRCRQTRINKLSGGQYKRVSIAQEMLSSPDILVLDEPTSGLDSLTCYRTVKVLRDLVEASKAHNLVNPMSIILTIHQPHREVLDLFHSIYVMAVGGLTLYQGSPSEMEECINKHSGIAMPAEGYNPASFMVELASEEYGKKPIESLVAIQREKFKNTTRHKYNFIDAAPNDISIGGLFKNGDQVKKTDSSITLYPLDNDSKFVDVNLGEPTSNLRHNSSSVTLNSFRDIDSRIMTPRSGKNSDGVFWRHVALMSKRCFLANTRDPLLFTMRVMAHIFIPLVVALIYGSKMGVPNGCPFYLPEINLFEYASMGVEEIREKHDAIRIQFQNVGLHFMVYYAFGLCMLAFTAISFPLIMHVLIKEIRNGWYSSATFILGKMIAELPLAIILPPISVGIIYYMTGQPSSYLQWRYMVQSLILILIIMIAEAKGLVFGAVCMNSMQTAVFAASVSTVPFILLSGFLIRIHEIPTILQGLAKFSYFKHSVEALIVTRYGYGMCPCDPSLIPPGGTPRIVGVSPQIMALTDYYLTNDSNDNEDDEETVTETNIPGNNRTIERIIKATTTLPPEIIGETEVPVSSRTRRSKRASRKRSTTTSTTTTTTTTTPEPETTTDAPRQGAFFDKMATLLTRANAFGYSIETCDDVEPFTMKDMHLTDDMLPYLISYLFLFIVILKLLSYIIVDFFVKLKL